MLRAIRQRQKGIAAVEFALVMPIVMVLVFGAIEYGMAFYRVQQLAYAVHEGVRQGIVNTSPKKTTAQIQSIVTTYLTNAGWNANSAVVTVAGAQGAAGAPLTVTCTYPSSFAVMSKLPFGGGISVDGNGNHTLTSTSTMYME